jgi:CxxC motif-containing protein (DUF1111 family)
MHRSYPLWCVLAAALVFGPVGWRVMSWQRPQSPAVDGDLAEAGEALFNHEWQPNDPLSPNGDGLGPVFNARSCAACHHQSGSGGSGAVEHNVTTFVVQGADGPPLRQGVIHAFATAEVYKETLALLDPSLPRISQPTLGQLLPGHVIRGKRIRIDRDNEPGLPQLPNVKLSQLNTPALFGIGLIDAIPEQDIIANERQQRLRFAMAPSDTETVPVGRVARLADGRIGRFGWKAQMASLSDFVQAACANELGLGNPGQRQPVSLAQPDLTPGGLDLTQMQCDQITAFVAALPRPMERAPSSTGTRAHAGKGIFTKIGCADCHAPSLGSVDGLYSDLLLHRMGMELESSNASYGIPIIPTRPKDNIAASPSTAPLPDEWRTPPLWGVADSAPYMHDGRAATLEEAIQQHGGQGAGAAQRFQGLNGAEQTQLIAFLKSLRAS